MKRRPRTSNFIKGDIDGVDARDDPNSPHYQDPKKIADNESAWAAYKKKNEPKQGEDKRSIQEKEADRPKALRITGLDAPARQLMSASGRMKLEARKLRRAGDKEGYKQLMRMASAEKLAGEPNVKSQAFVDAEQAAKRQGSPESKIMDSVMSFLDERSGPTKTSPRSVDDRTNTREMGFSPWTYKSDALAIINDPSHPSHNATTVASLKQKWGL